MMLLPPVLLRMKIGNPGSKGINLWIPLFLLWPLLLALGIVLAPVAIIISIVHRGSGLGKLLFFGGSQLYATICGLTGLKVQVRDGDNTVDIRFI